MRHCTCAVHAPGCRPGRPRCAARRRARGVCRCDAYHFPHRLNSGACRLGVPAVLLKSKGFAA